MSAVLVETFPNRDFRHVVSVSLGSAKRNHSFETTLLGQKFLIERVAPGDYFAAQELFEALDGKVDAFGLGGIDLYITGPTKRFELVQARRLIENVRLTPVVDGTGIKNTLEARVIRQLVERNLFPIRGQEVFVTCGMDRPGMARALFEAGGKMTFGDLILTLKIDEPITSLEVLEARAEKLLPAIARLPIGELYRIGKRQDEPPDLTFRQYFDTADIIAGDFHFILGYAPMELPDKIIITNTVTPENIEDLRRRGVGWLVTTTPDMGGRSFGTNVLEAVFVALLGALDGLASEDIDPLRDYPPLIERLNLQPRIERLD